MFGSTPPPGGRDDPRPGATSGTPRSTARATPRSTAGATRRSTARATPRSTAGATRRSTARGTPRGRDRERKRGRFLVVAGALLTAVGLVLAVLAVVGVTLAVTGASHDGPYGYTATERLHTPGHAITIVPVPLELDEKDAARASSYGLAGLSRIQLRAAPVDPDARLFLGIADAHNLESYLQDVPRARFDDDDNNLTDLPGTREPAPPAEQRIWEHSSVGPGTRGIVLDVRAGDWVAVIMNADGTAPVSADVQVGTKAGLFGPAGVAGLVAGVVGLAAGIPLMLVGAGRLRRARRGPAAEADSRG